MNIKNQYKITLPLMILPTATFLNAGSAMMMFGLLHMILLNAFIGITESEIIKRYHLENRTWLIILANYVSMFIGYSYIAPYFSTIAGNQDFWGGHTNYGDYELKGFMAGMMSSYLATLLIELPFFYFSIKDKLNRKKVLIPFFVANSVTNAILIIIYFLINNIGGHW